MTAGDRTGSEPHLSPSQRPLWLPGGALFVVVVVAFSLTLRGGFIEWDDQDLVVSNALLTLSAGHLKSIWSGPVFGLYTPLAYTVWALLAAAVGKAAWAFHLLNVLLHAGAAVAAYGVILRRCSSVAAAWLAALIWAVHPLQVEPVAWVSGMNNLLAGGLGLAAVATLPGRGQTSRWRYAVATILFCLGLLSKPSAVVFPLLALALIGFSRWNIFRLVPWLLLSAVAAFVAGRVQPATDAPSIALWERTIVAVDALGWYAGKAIFPWHLTPDVGRRPDMLLPAVFTEPYFYLGLAVLGLLIPRRTRFAGAWFILALLPVLGLRSFEFQLHSTVADRYAYIALLGPLIALASALTQRRARPWAAVLAAVLGVLTLIQISRWRDTGTLFTYAQAVRPDSALAPRILAFAAAKSGRLDEARRLYELSLARRDDPLTHYNFANLLLTTLHDPAAAESHFARAAARPSLRPQALTNRGIARELLARPAEAESDYRAAIAADPTYASPYANLGNLLERQGNIAAARELYLKALSLEPDLPSARRGLDRLGR